MKILVLTSDLIDRHGWGRYSLDVIDALEKENVEVVVGMGRKGLNDTDREALRILPAWGNNWRNYFCAFVYALRLRRYAKDCDYIHVFVEPYAYIAYWLALLSKKKYIITTHGSYGLVPFRGEIIKYFHKTAFSRAHKIVCVSSYTKERLTEFGFTNLITINNGINVGGMNISNNPTFDKRENLILSVGALKYRKGQHVSIEAFSRIAKLVADARYYIVGDQDDKPYYARLKQMVKDLNIEDRVVFLSAIPSSELADLYKKAKVFALPSISRGPYFEGFGLVYLEANAFGLPAIGSRESGARDAIEDGKTGFLVAQNDVDSLARAMSSLLQDNFLWKKMSECGTLWAKEHDWELVIKKYISLYQTR